MPAVYRLLHVSDLHLSDIPYSFGFGHPNPHWPTQSNLSLMTGHDELVLDALARFIYRYSRSSPPLFERVFITGDLATTGHATDLERAYRLLTAAGNGSSPWLHKRGNGEVPTLGFVEPQIEAMPGNHDRYEANPTCFPGSGDFDAVFNDLARPRQFWKVQQGAQIWQLMKKPGGRPLALIAADLTLHPLDLGQVHFAGWLGQGRAYPNVVADLEQKTQDVIDACRQAAHDRPGEEYWEHPAIIWAIHFDVTTAAHTLKLLDADNLIQALKRRSIPALLCGHTHESLLMPVTWTTNALIAGSATQGATLNRFDPAETANDIQLLQVDVPDSTVDPLKIEVTWFRYRPFTSTAASTASLPKGRFIPIASKVSIP